MTQREHIKRSFRAQDADSTTIPFRKIPMYANFLLFGMALLPALFCGCIGLRDATPTYNLIDELTRESIQCEMCPPGQYLVKHCNENRRTECLPCGNEHYTEVWNFIQRCQYCNRFCTENEIESAPCNSTQNRECKCKTGYYSLHDVCVKHKICPAGQGVVRNGTLHTNVKCERCQEGFFSAEASSTEACQKFSVCPPASTAIPIDGKQDVFCSQCKSNTGTLKDQRLCDNELIDFLTHLDLSRRTHSFKRLLRKKVEDPENDGMSIVQLLRLYRPNRPTSLGKEIHGILEKVNLLQVAVKVEKHFLCFS